MNLDKGQKLDVIDTTCLICYGILFMYQIFIITKYLCPLGIKDRYIIFFYSWLTVLLLSSMTEIIARLADGDPAYMVER